MTSAKSTRLSRIGGPVLFVAGLVLLIAAVLLLRIAMVTDYLYHATVKDPERTPPSGDVIVAPADGRVLYVKWVEDGTVPEMVKRGVPVPLTHHFKTGPDRRFRPGWLVGIYMNGDGVHVNRVPVTGRVEERIVFNGPHVDMTAAETTIIMTQLVPGWVSVKKLLGLPPYAIEDDADFVLKSARETMVIRDVRGARVYVTRIADYSVGKILTWVREGERVATGQKLGMITWGSQTDIFIEDTPDARIRTTPGRFVYGGETVLATY
jgi:phosphatidylserine decarboxylase